LQLNTWQKREIYENGYVHLPGVAPRARVNEALRAINACLGQGIDPERMTTFRSQSFCPELQGTPAITDLLNKTPAWELAESAIEPGKLRPAGGGQVALRFPSLQDPPPVPRPHLDGMYSPHNGVPEGEIHNFTMLAAVFLSDVTADYGGNFTVWPGTHRLFEGYFRKHGPESLLKGMPKVKMPDPVQLKCRAGDVALCHYQLAHSAAANFSPHVRYAIFFRLSHVDHAEHKFEVMKDIWLEWTGVREAVEVKKV
jgi:hypothetical protein